MQKRQSDRVPVHSLLDLERRLQTFSSVEDELGVIEAIYVSSPDLSLERAKTALYLAIYYELRDNKKAKLFFNRAARISKFLQSRHFESDLLHYRARQATRQNLPRLRFRHETESLELATGGNYLYRVASCKLDLGVIAFGFGAHEDAIPLLHSGLEIASHYSFLRLEARIQWKLAEIQLIAGKIRIARLHAQAAVEASERASNTNDLLESKVRLAAIELENGHLDHVSRFAQSINTERGQIPKSVSCMTHTLMGNVQQAKKKYKEAESEFKQALKLADYVNAERVRSNIHTHLSELYLKTKQYKPALKESLAALKDAETAQDVFVRKDALRLVHQCYKAIGKFKEAHKYLELYNELVAASDTALLKNRLEYHALRNEFEKERLVSADKARQSEILRLELVRKEQELTEKTRHLIKQTEALVQFRDDLRAMIRRSPSDDPLVKQIRERLQSLPDAQLNWEDFDVQFRNVHPEFLKNLVKKYPTLTTMQRKVCALLRLNLTSVDIAKLLYLSERNIENHRYRLRKKFCLDANGSLHDFLSTY
jgi:tetratricopeptide (TPR) repeat protein